MTHIILILLAATCNVLAQMSLKTLASQAQLGFSINSLYFTIFNRFFIIGISFYLVSLFLSIKIFETAKFSYVVPVFISFVFILTFLVSIFVFKESITPSKLLGILLILTGIFFVR